MSEEPSDNLPDDQLPVQSDTPPDHTVIGLRIDGSLLPEWYDAICTVVHPLCRRMSVLEKPDEWLLKVELPDENLPAFKQGLVTAWDEFVAKRKAEGRWEEESE
ncbi:MAG: hypothetical protein KDA24_27275 [Deltaproteobacteria bacterium]|nr:hypothetical protein [Deltaproteobacteria bacterium]